MSLATRCLYCGTIFRVAQEQLKVSEGWVRCGHCQEMFNALKGLFDLERDTPPAWSPEEGALAKAAASQEKPKLSSPTVALPSPFSAGSSEALYTPSLPRAPSLPSWTSEPQLLREDVSVPAVEVEPSTARYSVVPAALAPEQLTKTKIKSKTSTTRGVRTKDRSKLSRASRDMSAIDNRTGSEVFGSVSRFFKPTTPAQLTGLSDEVSASPPGSPLPKFVRQAQLQARWRSPPVRRALAVLSLILLLMLGLQGMHRFRDVLAARWPASQSALTAWCRVIGCQLEPPRRIEALSVESTSFLRVGESDSFRFSVALKNSSPTPVALPSIELSLTDANGQLLARRALLPQEFSKPPAFLSPRSEHTLQALLSASQLNVSGYTVELFYP